MYKFALFGAMLFLFSSLHAQTKHQVTANSDQTFKPNTLSIAVGDTVMWTNNGGFHNVNGSIEKYPDNPEGFTNGAASTDAWNYEFVFTKAGVYNYQCDPHLTQGMTGSITVNAPAGGVVITEIMYNPPGADSELEYLELYNAGANAVNLLGYSFSGFTFTFPGFNLGAGEYVIIATDSVFFENTFGLAAFEMDNNTGLNNGGELIQLLDVAGAIVDEVDYEPDGAWPLEADGLGASLVLCDPLADNSDPANWDAASTATDVVINGFSLFANPGAAAQCLTGPLVSFGINDMTVNEAALTLFIPVILSQGDAGSTTTVDVGVGAASSAILNTDFIFTDNTLTFAPGAENDTVLLNLRIIDDTDIETLDTLILELSNPSAEASIDPFGGSRTIVIQDNDAVIPDLVITEIMYNPPESNTDSLEFIEIYNNDDTPVDMTGYSFTDGVVFTFPTFTLATGEYVLVGVDSIALATLFSATAFEYQGALSNGGEKITLSNPGGAPVIDLTFSDDPPWPSTVDGDGSSLVLCDPKADANDGANWTASTTSTGVIINNKEIFASPGAVDTCEPPGEVNYPAYDVSAVNTVNETGIADSLGIKAQLQGIVYGVNLRPGGLEFTLIESDGDGIGVFNNNQDFTYSVMEGDELIIRGTIGQFNGLTQITVDTLEEVSMGNALLDATVVTALDESTESQLIVLEGVELVDTSQWMTTGSFNVSVTNGVDTFLVRIDGDTNIAGSEAPVGPFNITGIGGQFDNTAPYTEGYQLLPRYQSDIDLISTTIDPGLARFVSVYPNPTREYLQLELSETFDQAKLYNSIGQEVLEVQQPTPSNRLELGNFAKGMYTLVFVKGNRIWSTQVVKQ